MSYRTKLGMAVVISLGLSASAAAQRLGMAQAPHIPGLFSPVIGSGAEYQITGDKGEPLNWTYAVVGQEDFEGQKGYWMEVRTTQPRGEMITKSLMVMNGDTPGVKRMIMQVAGRPPMELPVGMMERIGRQGMDSAPAAGANHGMGEKVGTETITVPAGTFVCDHYKGIGGDSTADAWVSTQVAPYGLVKMTSAKTTMVLQKVLDHETSKITGEPQKMPTIPGIH